jgi:tetratricopeptide (TPR) repeat protein
MEFYGRSLAIKRELGDQRAVAITLYNMGSTAAWQGDYATGRPLIEEAVTVYKELGDQRLVADGTVSIGQMAMYQGDYREARKWLEEGLVLHRSLGYHQGHTGTLVALGQLARREGRRSEAITFITEALTLCTETQMRQEAVNCLTEFAHLAAAEGKMFRAARLLAAGQAIGSAVGLILPPADRDIIAETEAAAKASLGEAVSWRSSLSASLDSGEFSLSGDSSTVRPERRNELTRANASGRTFFIASLRGRARSENVGYNPE